MQRTRWHICKIELHVSSPRGNLHPLYNAMSSNTPNQLVMKLSWLTRNLQIYIYLNRVWRLWTSIKESTLDFDQGKYKA